VFGVGSQVRSFQRNNFGGEGLVRDLLPLDLVPVVEIVLGSFVGNWLGSSGSSWNFLFGEAIWCFRLPVDVPLNCFSRHLVQAF
jgi:hypothetical protein